MSDSKKEDHTKAEITGSGSGAAQKKKDAVSNYLHKIAAHRKNIRRRYIILAILIVAAIVALAVWAANRHYSRGTLDKVADFVTEDGAKFVGLNGNIAEYGMNGASCVTSEGKTLWSITYEMEQPVAETAGQYLVIADKNAYDIYILNTDGQTGHVKTNMPIHSVTVAQNGEVAAVLDDSSSTWVRLYGSDGSEIAYFVRTMRKNGYPIAAAISPDGTIVCLANLKMDNASVKTDIQFYNFGKEGQDVAQHMVGSYDYTGEVFPIVKFAGAHTCVAVSDSRIATFDTAPSQPASKTNSMQTEQIQGVFFGDKYIGLLFTDTTGENMYRLDVYNSNGKKKGSVGFSMNFTGLQIVGNKVYINNDQECQIFKISGREIFSGGLESPIKALIPDETGGRISVVTENELNTLQLR